jgi:DNA polymerase V
MPGTGINTTGFPSPAQDFTENRLDLNQLLIAHPAATFFMRADGEAMAEDGIHAGDILVVDRALTPVHRDVVVAVVDGELMVRRLGASGYKRNSLHQKNISNSLIIKDNNELTIWGVVTHVIHLLRRSGARPFPFG